MSFLRKNNTSELKGPFSSKVPFSSNKTTPVSFFVIDASPKILAKLEQQFTGKSDLFKLIGTSLQGRAGILQVRDLLARGISIDVVLIDLDADVGGTAVKELVKRIPCVAVTWIPDEESARLESALTAGAKLYLEKPYEAKDLFSLLSQSKKLGGVSDQKLTNELAGSHGRIITLIGGKGGIGTTTISLNLALALRAKTGKSVVAIDACFQSGDLALLCGIKTSYPTIVNLFDSTGSEDGELAKVLIDGPGNVKLLASATKREQAESITAERFLPILQELRSSFEVVVIDCPSWVTEETMEILEVSNDILLITDQTPSSIRGISSLRDLLLRFGLPENKLQFIVNNVHVGRAYNLKEIQKILNTKSFVAIGNDSNLALESAISGKPFGVDLEKHRTPLAAGIEELVENLEKNGVSTTPRKKRLFGG